MLSIPDEIDNTLSTKIPRHKSSSITNDIISISYIPTSPNNYNKRIENIGQGYTIEYIKNKILVKTSFKGAQADSNQLKFNFE